MTDELFKLLRERENRTAFIAALIMERCTSPIPHYHVGEGGNTSAPTFNPAQAARIAETLVSLSGAIKRYAEMECSREMSLSEQRSAERMQAKFLRIAELIGLEGRAGGDPRGACAYLVDPANPSDGDGWGNGWAVYR